IKISHTQSVLLAILVFVTTAIVFSQYGFEGALRRDNAIYIYSGQQMANGIPPYVSMFDHKGPLTPMISGVGVMIAAFLNFDDILTVRIIFFMFACLTVVGLYLLGSTLFESRWIGILAAFTFIGFWGFGKHAVSGPQAKTPMVFFEVLALLLTANRKWFWAAFCGSLSFLTWQPMAIYPIVTIILAIAQSKRGHERTINVIRAISGALTPIVMVSIYFLYKNAFYELIDGAILFNIVHLERSSALPYSNIIKPLVFAYRGYTLMFGPIVLGLLTVCVMYVWRLKLYERSISNLLSKDPFAIFLLSFPAPVIWSLLDFQGYTDFFVFLPYAAIGFGWLLYLLLDSRLVSAVFRPGLVNIFFLVICAILVGSAAMNYRMTSKTGLKQQRQWADQLKSQLGKESKFLSIGRPSILALLHMTNPNRYLFIVYGIDNHIHANTPGGFYGWLKGLEKYNPSMIALGKTGGRYKDQLLNWLHTHYRKTTLGEWTLFVKRE
ncbi:MAG: hypothetical protein KAJ10_07690, partial [Thermodesulfovibrionia bacterium]|nr:hypothetical protein [Thermodesulfovibrionia bacterium]